MTYYAVYYRKANSKNNFIRSMEEYTVTRGQFAGEKNLRFAKYSLATAESLVAHLTARGYEAKIKETKSGTYYEKHYAE